MGWGAAAVDAENVEAPWREGESRGWVNALLVPQADTHKQRQRNSKGGKHTTPLASLSSEIGNAKPSINTVNVH